MYYIFFFFFFLMIRRPPRSTPLYSSAASDVYKRQPHRPCSPVGPKVSHTWSAARRARSTSASSPTVRTRATAAWSRCPVQYSSWPSSRSLYRGCCPTWPKHVLRYPSGSIAPATRVVNRRTPSPTAGSPVRRYSQASASRSLYASESEKHQPCRSPAVRPEATRSKFASQPSRSIHCSQWSSVARAFVACNEPQNPPASATSATPSGLQGPRDGATGAPPVRSVRTALVVTTLFSLVPDLLLHGRPGSGPAHGKTRGTTAAGARRHGSVLDRPGRHARGNVPLSDHKQDRRGHRRDNGGGHDRVPLGRVAADVLVDAQRDRDHRPVPVQGRGEDEVRPGPQEGEQRHRDDGVAADWQDHGAEGLPGVRSVDLRRLDELLGDTRHEGREQQHAERNGDRGVRRDQADDRVEPPESEVDRVEAHGHDHCGDHLGDQEDEVQGPRPSQSQLGERVAGRRGDDERERDGPEPDEQTRRQRRHLLVEHGLVSLGRRVPREPVRRIRPHVLGLGEGDVHHPVDGEEHQRGEEHPERGLPPPRARGHDTSSRRCTYR